MSALHECNDRVNTSLPRRSGSRLIAGRLLLGISLLALAGCGAESPGFEQDPVTGSGGTAGGGTGGGMPAGSPSTGGGGAASATPARLETTRVDESFWHAGWKVTLGEAKLTVLAGSTWGELTFEAHLENLGTSSDYFDSRLLLTDGAEDYTFEASDSEVPGGRATDLVWKVSVAADFSLEDATLIVGNPSNNQATVPIGENSPDELVSLEPVTVTAADKLVAGEIQIEVERAELRADDPDEHDAVEAGELLLMLELSVTLLGDITGSVNVCQGNLQLREPDGTAIAPDTADCELLEQVGETVSGMRVSFLVPKPVRAEYTLVGQGYYIQPENRTEWAEHALLLEVPENESFAE